MTTTGAAAALGALLVVTSLTSSAAAQEVAPVSSEAPWLHETDEYRTPFAGEPLETEVLGAPVHLDRRDRTNLLAISLGSSVFSPRIGDQRVVPFAALFYQRASEARTIRAVVAGVVNQLDYTERLGELEGIAHLDNFTIPLATSEIVDGRAFDPSDIRWGTMTSWVGVGYRVPIAPFEVDNDLRLQAYYHAGYFYAQRVADTAPDLRLPSDTFVHGVGIRLRADALRRNLLELPHAGWAFGLDATLTRRDHWRDFGLPGVVTFERQDTRDSLKVSGYVTLAVGLPLLSERHRLVAQVHGGYSPGRSLDRFSAFRLGGGPPATEASDLARSPYPGAMFDQFPTRRFVLASLEYRLELTFFLFVHLRATVVRAVVPTLEETPGRLRFAARQGAAFSAAITSGFLWSSTVYVEYSYDVGAVRGEGREGHGVLLAWSKLF